MNTTIIKSRIESCGLEVIDIKVSEDNDCVQLFIEGGPIQKISSGEQLKLQGSNLRLMEGIFPRNFEICRTIANYKRSIITKREYQIVTITSNPFVCRDVLKSIRQLELKATMTVKKGAVDAAK